MNDVNRQYNMNLPLTWTQFKAMPIDWQKDYVAHLTKKYEIGPSALAEMFGVGVGTCGKYLKETLELPIDGRSSSKKREKFLASMSRAQARAEKAQQEAAEMESEAKSAEPGPSKPSEKTPLNPRPGTMVLPKAALTFQGAFAPADIANSLAALYAPGTPLNISIEITLLEDAAKPEPEEE